MLLMHPTQVDRPDALFIADDNMVDHCAIALAQCGVVVPRDLHVISHCNFPWPPPSVLPIRRIGFEVPRLIQLAVDAIDLQRRGQTPPENQYLPAYFEDELPLASRTFRHRFILD